MKKIYCLVVCLTCLSLSVFLSLGQALAAVRINMSFSPSIFVVPNVDLVRQSIVVLSLEADQPYAVELSARSGGVLVNGFNTIPYRVSYNNGPDMHLTEAAKRVESNSSSPLVSREITITILGADTATAVAGDYSSTLVVTITSL